MCRTGIVKLSYRESSNAEAPYFGNVALHKCMNLECAVLDESIVKVRLRRFTLTDAERI